jgi:hypothetical protein
MCVEAFMFRNRVRVWHKQQAERYEHQQSAPSRFVPIALPADALTAANESDIVAADERGTDLDFAIIGHAARYDQGNERRFAWIRSTGQWLRSNIWKLVDRIVAANPVISIVSYGKLGSDINRAWRPRR